MLQHYLSLNTIKFKRNLTMSKSIYTPSEQFCKENYYPIAYEAPADSTNIPPWNKGKSWKELGVNTSIFANHGEKNGMYGNSRKGLSEGEKNGMYGKKHSLETIKKMKEKRKDRKPNLGKVQTENQKKAVAKALRGLFWWNNGEKNIRSKIQPEGYTRGRINYTN